MGELNRNKYLTITAIVFLLTIGAYFLLQKNSKNSSAPIPSQKLTVAPAKAKTDLYKDLSFPILDERGETITNIKLTVQDAQLQDEIIVGGQKATSVSGKTFLIINFKLTNDFNKSITLKTRDYFRLSVNGNDKEMLAPEIYNDPVEILAISTKYDRVGFPINDSDKNLTLKVGEITKDKTNIPLSLGK